MADKWRVVTLGDVADLVRGVSYRPSDLLADGAEGIPLLRATNIKNQALELADVLFVPPALVRDHQRLRRFDVVIAMSSGSRDAVGRLAQLRRDWVGCVGAFCGVVRADPKRVHPEYLGYVLQSPAFRTHVETRAVGTAIMNLSRDRILGFTLRLPDLPEQSAIAHILGTLDDKIELNRKQNETLEAMARALFKAWFVDFEPVRAKMEGRWQRGQSLPGLPAHLYDLFPDRLVESELGEIPEGWETKRVSDYLSLAYGKSLPAGKRQEGIYPVYGSGGLVGFHNEAMINGPTVIVGRKGTVGSLYWEDRPCFPIDTVFYVQPKVPLSFCYYLLESLPLRDMNTDAAVPGLNRENVYRLEVAAPPRELVSHFAETTSRFRESIAAISKSTEALSQLRDTLLPKLISGELRVPDVERIVGGLAQ